MPKPSERKDLISEVVDLLAVEILEEDFDEDLGGFSPFNEWEELIPVASSVDALFDMLQQVLSRRYLSARETIARSHEFVEPYFQSLPDEEFLLLTRTTRASFQFICGKIKTHRVFHNNSKHLQAPVWLQLAVALDKLGTYGSGSTQGRTKIIWGVGKGTLDLFTARVVIALNDLSDVYVKWPDEETRRNISRRMASEGFPGCVGFIDGATFPLSQKSSINGECYFDVSIRIASTLKWSVMTDAGSSRFSVGGLGLVLIALSTVIWHSQMMNSINTFFSEDQHLITDSAYPADTRNNTIIPAYKKSQRGHDNSAFNTCVAHVRVVNEHTIGVLKARWTSLGELRLQIKRKEDIERLLRWINACVVLHNILFTLGDGWSEARKVDNHLPADTTAYDDETFPFRRRLKQHAVAIGREPGRILWLRGE